MYVNKIKTDLNIFLVEILKTFQLREEQGQDASLTIQQDFMFLLVNAKISKILLKTIPFPTVDKTTQDY